VLYHNMVRTVQCAGGRVRGILWYQGESDATGGPAETYLQRFGAAVAAWRDALGDPQLPILTVQLNRYYTPPTEDLERAWPMLREAQRQVRAVPLHAPNGSDGGLRLGNGCFGLLAGRVWRIGLHETPPYVE